MLLRKKVVYLTPLAETRMFRCPAVMSNALSKSVRDWQLAIDMQDPPHHMRSADKKAKILASNLFREQLSIMPVKLSLERANEPAHGYPSELCITGCVPQEFCGSRVGQAEHDNFSDTTSCHNIRRFH